MDQLLEKLLTCVEFGKVDIKSPYPPAMKDQEGAFELTRHALDDGISPGEILEEALIPAMSRVRAEVLQKRDICSPDAYGGPRR